MALSNDDLQAITKLMQGVVAPLQEDIKSIKSDISNIKSDMHDNNDFLLTEMERLHNIQTRKIDNLSEKVDTIRDNKETTDYLLRQLSDLKKE